MRYQQPMIGIAVGAVTDALGIATAPPAGDDPDLSDTTTFHETLCQAGFVDVTVTRFPLRISWASDEEYAAWARDMMVELGDLIRAHAPDRVEQIFAAVADVARTHAAADGQVVCTNIALMGAGRRPG